jgi:hypothetical protein
MKNLVTWTVFYLVTWLWGAHLVSVYVSICSPLRLIN